MKVKLAGSGNDAEKFRVGELRGKAQNWARFLSDMPANHMTPVQLAQVHFSMAQLFTDGIGSYTYITELYAYS